jgi:hypothetical protein
MAGGLFDIFNTSDQTAAAGAQTAALNAGYGATIRPSTSARIFNRRGASSFNRFILQSGGTPQRTAKDCYAKTHLVVAVAGDRKFCGCARQSGGRA